jgi:hypothetical protein
MEENIFPFNKQREKKKLFVYTAEAFGSGWEESQANGSGREKVERGCDDGEEVDWNFFLSIFERKLPTVNYSELYGINN